MTQNQSKWEACLSILRCPRSGTALRVDGQSLVSAGGNRYPIVDGKPVLVRNVQPFHVTPPAANITSQNVREYTPTIDAGPGWKLHLGAGNVPAQDASVLSLDILPLPNVDMVVEAEALPFADNSVVYYEAGAVFEHLYDPFAAAEEFRRVLADGGLFCIDTAFMQGYHGFPSHYLNMTPQAVETFLLDDFELVLAEIPSSGGPTYHLENSIRRFIDALPPGDRDNLLSLSVEDFLQELTTRLRERPLPEFIKVSLAASVIVGGRKPSNYHARRDSVHREIGADAFKRLKRDYYALRIALIERHFEVEYYAQEVSARTGRPAPPLKAVANFLNAGKVVDPLDPASWTSACDQLRMSEDSVRALRDRWISAFLSHPAAASRSETALAAERRLRAAAEAELAKMLASQSWRVTAPLRWIRARMSRNRPRKPA
jgi:SAM-dependent methyltransferase